MESDTNEGEYIITPAKLTIYQYKDLTGQFWKLPCPTNYTQPSESSSSYSSTSDYTYTEPTSYVESFFGSLYVTSQEFTHLDDDFDPVDLTGDFSVIENTYDLTLSDPLGPLNLTISSCELQNLMYAITEMKIEFSFKAANIGLAIVPYFWDIEMNFKIIGGQVQPHIIISHRITNIIGITSGDIFSVLNVILLLLALVCGGFSVYSMFQSISIFLRTKRKYKYYQTAAVPGDYVCKFIFF